MAAIGTVATVGGLAYAYKVFYDEKYDPMESFKWVQDKLGLSNVVETTVAQPVVKLRKEDSKGIKAGPDTQYL